MNKIQEDTLGMYEAVDAVLKKQSSVWSGNVPFSQAVSDLENSIEEIFSQSSKQSEDITGVVEDKKERRKSLEQQTLTISGALVFYATTINDIELPVKVRFTKTKLAKARDNELPGISGQVLQAAQDHAAAILPFGITAVKIADLAAAIEDFVDYINKPLQAEGETGTATREMAGQFKSTDKLLAEQLDNGMELFKAAQPGFYSEYFLSRKIIHSPRLKRALVVQFLDDVTGNALIGVRVNIGKKQLRRSSKHGFIRVQSLKEGTHKLKATLNGYVQSSKSFTIVSGETTTLVVRMKKG